VAPPFGENFVPPVMILGGYIQKMAKNCGQLSEISQD
jgi:hypothetical protein